MELEPFVDAVSAEARALVDGSEREYDVAWRLWSLAMSGIRDERTRDVAHPLWLIWGDLTDRVDGPAGGKAGAEEAAATVMRAAASEWLSAVEDRANLATYFDRWVYDECGYSRSGSDS